MRHILILFCFFLSVLPAAAQDPSRYLGSGACVDCHRDAAEIWRKSQHSLAWTAPSADTVLGDFDGAEYSLRGLNARFSVARDGSYRIRITETDGSIRDYPVHSVVGVEPLQQYLLETEPGRLQSFDVVWDTKKQQWFHLYPDLDLPPDDGLHWTGPYKNWNARCAECHATGFRKNYDQTSRSYASTQVEMGVGCEACHGPGAEHVDWADNPGAYAEMPLNAGFDVDFGDPAQAIAQCATCHSRREAQLDGNPPPGSPYDDVYTLSLLRPGLYHADGQILDEVYVYGSFLQSKMYAQGVTCLNCHRPHEAELRAEGNAVCTQCHNPGGNPDFPSLTLADYDSPAHMFHESGSAGAQCKNCHMTEQVYMGNDWRADHSFRVPRPDLTPVTGAPDACTQCHENRDAAWAAGKIAEWYPDSRNRVPHYGEVLARGRADAVQAAPDLLDLAADPERPGIVRATALWLLEGSNSPSAAGTAAPLLADPDPLVRAAAAGLQRLAAPVERGDRLSGALSDPSRNVRTAAARAMLGTSPDQISPPVFEDLRRAFAEWQAAMRNRLDFPETHLQIAGLALTGRNLPAANSAFREALRMDPQRVEAWVMLIRIAAATRGVQAVPPILNEALQANPDAPELLGIRQELGIGAPNE